MMLKREFTPQDGTRPGSRTRGSRAGSVFGILAGVAMVCTGATAAALAGSHAAVAASTGGGCQTLPSAPTSPGPSPSQTATAGTNNSTPPVSSVPDQTPTSLCVTVTAQASSVNSGSNALYGITVKPKGGKAGDVTVQISASPSSSTPAFTVCGKETNKQTCSLGTMSKGQATALQAEIAVPSKASTGEAFTLSATVSGAAPGATTSGSVTGSATVSAVAPTPTPSKTHTSPPPSHHHTGSGHHHSGGNSGSNSNSADNGSSGTTGNTNPLAGLPPLTSADGGSTNPPGSNPSGLFPTISPSSSATPGTAGSTSSKTQRPYRATTVADVLPLNPDQLSTQVAALVVLGIGIILVFARISLRRPKSSETK
jgi:hypothetical protein